MDVEDRAICLVRLWHSIEFAQRFGEPSANRHAAGFEVCTYDVVACEVERVCEREAFRHAYARDENRPGVERWGSSNTFSGCILGAEKRL